MAEPQLVYDAKEKARKEAVMEQELTVEELIALINSQKGDFIIRIEFGEEADSCDREERLQT